MSRRAFAQSGVLTTGDSNGEVRLSTQASQDEAGIWTVQFAVPTKPDFGAAAFVGWLRPVATVSWMIAGNQIVRQIEVGDGTTISGTCEAVTVRVVDNSTAVPAGVTYNVTIAATPGLRPIGPNPPYLFAGTQALTIAPSTGVAFIRPHGAGVNSVRVLLGGNGASPNPPNVNIRGGSSPGTPVFSIDMAGATRTDTGWIPWPPEAGFLMIIDNADAANSINATVFWGVDG